MRWVIFFFVVVPLVELYLLLWLGSLIGFWPTVGITLVTGILGGSMAKREGVRVYRRWQQALRELRTPEEGIIDGVLVLVGGTLLVTPGVLTDITGLVLVVPVSRRPVARHLRHVLDRYLERSRLTIETRSYGAPERRDVVDTSGQTLD